jgi:hypothetical protein
MATKILLKKSVTGGASPLTSDLDQGELAVNLVDRKIYTKDNGNNIKELTGAYVDSVAPANPVEGDVWYDTANNLLKAYDGSSFESAGYQTLGALEDVTLTSITAGDHLTWNGSAFVNSNLESDVEGFLSAANTGTGHGTLSYANGEYSFAKVTAANIRGEVSAVDAGGDGSFGYNSTTGAFTYTGPSAAEAQAHFSAAHTAATFGGLTYLNGVYTHTGITAEEIEDVVGAQIVTNGTHTNIVATYDDANDGAIDLSIADTVITGKISVTDSGGDGSLGYNSTTGVITYQGPVQADVLAHLSGGTGVSLSAGGEIALDFADAGFKTDNVVEGTTNLYYTDERVDDRVGALVVGGTNITATYDDAAGTLTIDQDTSAGLDLSNNDTDDLAEGSTNQYYLDSRARAAISVTDAGGDGSASYNSGTGVITYTGPSAAEVRAHHTGGTGVTITAGSIAIGQAVETTSDVTFNKVTTDLIEGGSTITIDPAATGDNTGTVVIAGDLTVNGTTTTVNSNEVNIGDAIILLNSDETGAASANAGIEIERGTDANVSFIWNEADDKWDLNNEELQNVVLDGGSY